MAWMKSPNTGKFYRTEDLTVYENVPAAVARGVSDVLGFNAAVPESVQAITEELTRVKVARASLVKEIADTVLAAIAGGITITAEVDESSISALVQAGLADEFAAVNENIDNQPGIDTEQIEAAVQSALAGNLQPILDRLSQLPADVRKELASGLLSTNP
jgi:hypothetical protein